MPTGTPVDASWADTEFFNGAAATSFGAAINASITDIGALETASGGKVDKSTATAKGDLFVATAAGTIVRLPAGTTGQVLTVDPTQAAGLKYAASAGGFADPLTTAGDIVVRDAAAGTTRKAVGTTGQVLRANPANSDKTEWATLGPADVGLGNVSNTSNAAVRAYSIAVSMALG
jgi:hypothetical protein